MSEDVVYNPGYVKRFQKPWFRDRGIAGIKYCGQFADGWYCVNLKFGPLLELVDQIDGSELKAKLKLLIDEMQDACIQCKGDHIMSLPSAD